MMPPHKRHMRISLNPCVRVGGCNEQAYTHREAARDTRRANKEEGEKNRGPPEKPTHICRQTSGERTHRSHLALLAWMEFLVLLAEAIGWSSGLLKGNMGTTTHPFLRPNYNGRTSTQIQAHTCSSSGTSFFKISTSESRRNSLRRVSCPNLYRSGSSCGISSTSGTEAAVERKKRDRGMKDVGWNGHNCKSHARRQQQVHQLGTNTMTKQHQHQQH